MKEWFQSKGFTNNAVVRSVQVKFEAPLEAALRLFIAMLRGEKYAKTNLTVYFSIEENEVKRVYRAYTVPKPTLSIIFAPLSIYVPTVMLLTALVILLISKIVLDLYKVSMLHFVEVVTQEDPERNPKGFLPGTLVGVLLGVLAAIAKAGHELWKR